MSTYHTLPEQEAIGCAGPNLEFDGLRYFRQARKREQEAVGGGSLAPDKGALGLIRAQGPPNPSAEGAGWGLEEEGSWGAGPAAGGGTQSQAGGGAGPGW